MTRVSRLLAVALLAPALAAAQLRTLPEGTERGRIEHGFEMMVRIDGAERLLAPGAQIRDQRNLLIVPSALPRAGEAALAEYTTDANGQVARVWLLTPAEAARPRPRSGR